MSALTDLLAPPADEPQASRRTPTAAPSGWTPQAEWDAEQATITTEPWQAGDPEPGEAALLSERGLDPKHWRVVTVRYGEWQQSKRLENGDRDTITLRSKRVVFARQDAVGNLTPDHLVSLLQTSRRTVPKTTTKTGTPAAFVHAGGDYQLGKTDGDGVEGTVARFHQAIGTGMDRLAGLRKRYDIGAVYLPHLGDCIEGYVSQGGRNAMRTGLPLTEQVDLLILLLTEQVRAYAGVADKLVVPIIPGNHDEALRVPVNGLEHDSWATFAAKQLRRSLSMAGKAYDHVRIVTPPRGELTLLLDIGGTRTGMAHGHQFTSGKAIDWLADQTTGMQLVGDAQVLLSAHNHHLVVQQPGARTAIQVPALEGESRWWRHRKGQQSPPGMVSLLMGDQVGRSLTLPDGHTVRTGWTELEVV